MDAKALYESDFHEWLLMQAAALRRAASMDTDLGLDFENLAEEIESAGRAELIAIERAWTHAVSNLLTLQHSPAPGPRTDRAVSATLQRQEAEEVLRRSPSVLGKVDLDEIYADARKLAAVVLEGDGIAARDLPESCPYTLDQIRDEDWWPANRHGLD